MQQDRSVRAGLARRIGHLGLFVALAVVPVLALNSLATADTGSDPHVSTTDSQRECLTEQGITLPTRGSGSTTSDHQALTSAQREQLWKAARSCGLHGGTGLHPLLRRLTDEQRQCLTEQGAVLPTRQPDGTRPTITADQRAMLRQAAAACGLLVRGPHGQSATLGKI